MRSKFRIGKIEAPNEVIEAMKLPIDRRLLVMSVVVAGAIFVFDVMVEPHVAATIAYVGLVLMCRGSNWPPFALWLAALATGLSVAGFFTSEAEFSTFDLANRAVALLVIWLTAFLCSRLIRTAEDLKSARSKLQHQKDRASTTATRAVRALRSERNDRARIEEELEETEQRYRAVFNQTYQFVAVLDPEGAVEEVNETMYGLGLPPAADVIGQPIWNLPLWNDEGRERLHSAVRAAASGDFVRDEFRIEQSSGGSVIVDLSLKPIRNPTGWVDLIILEARDITQHKRDQSMLIQTQKMEVLGQFASGIAHDFNNLLTVIAGNLELAERRVRSNDAAKRIAKAVNAVFQGRSLTDRILAFARKKQLEPCSIEVNALVSEVLGLSEIGLHENMTIEREIAAGLWPCWADPAQLQTALLNLLVNARDAMPKGGRITVRAVNATLQPESRRDRPNLPGGDYVVLSVEDEGEGIPAAILDKVTDPFFTTKAPGSGSGLGLSMVAGFTKQSDGDLVISSTEGRGTKVSLYLPRANHAAARPGNGPEWPVSRGNGRILVVEDDPEVRDVAVTMLTDLGYHVAEASDGEEAALIMRKGQHFDLLLTDVMMPGDKDGRDLGRLARTILPELGVLYSSGNPETAVGIRPIKEMGEDFISKPYHHAELARKIERLLSRANKMG